MIKLRTLGSIDLLRPDGHEVAAILAQPKRLGLLIYLALASPGSYLRRDTLIRIFWPEIDESHARNALSQSLSFLRSHLPQGTLINRAADEVGIADGAIQSDTEAFRIALSEEQWAEALDLYGGDFLSGFHAGALWEFEEWVREERERFREEAAGAAWSLAREQIHRGLLVDSERAAQQAIGLIWTDETPVRDFIKAMAEAGDRVAALNFYQKYRQRIQEQLQVEPSPETRAVAASIRDPSWDSDAASGVPVEDPDPSAGSRHPEGDAVSPAAGEMDSAHRAPSAGAEPQGHPMPASGGGGGPWKLWFWSLAAAAIVCFGIVGILRARGFFRGLGPPSPDRPFTVLAHVDGTAPLEVREAAAFLLRTGLDMAHVIQTVPEPEVHRILNLMDRDRETRLGPAVAREVAIRMGVRTVVLPRLDRLGPDYVLILRVEDVQTGRLQNEARGVSGEDGRVVAMVDEVVRNIRRDLGESRRSLAASDPLPQVITPSLEALEAYREAEVLTSRAQVHGARTLLWRAVQIDTAFAMAWQQLSDNYLHQPRDFDSSAYAAERSRQFRHRLTEARWADVELYRRIHQDIALWDEALYEAERAVVRDPTWIESYALRLSHEGGMPDSAWTIYINLEARRIAQARRFDPEQPYSTPCFLHQLRQSVSLDRTREWMDLLDSLHVDVPPDCAQDLDFFESQARGDWDRADSLLNAKARGWRWPSGVAWTSRQLLAVRGHIRDAHSSLGPNDQVTFGVPETQRTRLSHLFLDLVFHLPPHEPLPGPGPMELLGRGKFPVVDFLLYGIREGFLGDTLEAVRVSRRLRSMRDTATSQTFERSFDPWFILLDVTPAYRRGDWEEVIGSVEPMMARIYDPGVGGYLPGAAFLSWWILAEACEATGDPHRAIGYLENFFQRHRRRLDDWAFHGFFRPSARLKLGRLLAEVGDTTGALHQYQEFLAVFTEPDREFQWMVDEARAALSSMGSGPEPGPT